MFANHVPRYIQAYAVLNAIAIALALTLVFIDGGIDSAKGIGPALMVAAATLSVGLGSVLYCLVHRDFNKAMVLFFALLIITITMMVFTFVVTNSLYRWVM